MCICSENILCKHVIQMKCKRKTIGFRLLRAAKPAHHTLFHIETANVFVIKITFFLCSSAQDRLWLEDISAEKNAHATQVHTKCTFHSPSLSHWMHRNYVPELTPLHSAWMKEWNHINAICWQTLFHESNTKRMMNESDLNVNMWNVCVCVCSSVWRYVSILFFVIQ